MELRSTNDLFVIERVNSVFSDYLQIWSSLFKEGLQSDFAIRVTSLKDALIGEMSLMGSIADNPKKELEFTTRVYEPSQLREVTDVSYLYEFESILDEYLDDYGDLLDDDKKQLIWTNYHLLRDLLDTWYQYRYGYSLSEFETEMKHKEYGVFKSWDSTGQ